MDGPFVVRSDQIQRKGVVRNVQPLFHVVDLLFGQGRFITRQSLAEGPHPGMILIDGLPAGHCAPGDKFVHIGVVGGIIHLVRFDTAPDRRVKHPPGLLYQIVVPDLCISPLFGKVFQVKSGWFFQRFPGLARGYSVAFRRKGEDGFYGLQVGFHGRHAVGASFALDGSVEVFQEFVFLVRPPRNAFARNTGLFQ